MTADDLAELIVVAIGKGDNHPSDDAFLMTDEGLCSILIDGRVDMIRVAEELLVELNKAGIDMQAN